MLIGQIWANVASYCYWVIDSKSELIELCSSEDNESEEEENKKEKDAKVLMDLNTSRNDILKTAVKVFNQEDFLSLHHPEITTPPPESFLS